MHHLGKKQRLFLVLSAIFLTALLIANVVAGKFFTLAGVALSVGVIPFPITFLLTDVINEYYGTEGARFITLVGLAMMLFANAMIGMALVLPVARESPVPDPAFWAVFGLSWRLFAGSLIAYLLGQLSDIKSFELLKRVTGSKLLWLRATGSTAMSQVIDTLVVNLMLFVGTMPFGQILGISAWSYVYKMIVAVALTPLLYVAHGIIKRWLGIEAEPPEPAPAVAE